jgi:hypothetical protein
MPEKVQAQQVQTPQEQAVPQKSGKKTIFFVAIPIVLLQIVIAYLLVLDLNSKTNSPSDKKDEKAKTQAVDKKIGDEYKINESEYVISHLEFLFVVKDLIVNPAGTGG